MTIGDVFARAWDLWRKSIGWLILAGLVVGAIMALTFAIIFGIVSAVVAGAASTAGNDLMSNSGSSLSALGAGLGVLGLIVYVVAMFLVQVLAITFYGGMFEMVIGAYRQKRDVRFGDLFAGFRHFSAYVVYALVLLGVSLGLNVLGLLPFLGALIAFVVSIWLTVIWMYVLPLIADQGVGFMEAAGRSKQMVGNAGWWWTFGMVILLGFASLAAFVVILLDRLGLLQDERVRRDRQRHPAVPAVRGPLPALRDLLRQRAVHRLRRGRGPGAGRRRAARHPAGSAGSSGVRHAGLAHSRRAGFRRLRRRAEESRGREATTPGRPRRTRSRGRRLRLRRSRRRPRSRRPSQPAGDAAPEQTAATDAGAPPAPEPPAPPAPPGQMG